MSLTTGARLGPYEIVSALGRGGMGQVYRARHVKLEREVAIKVLPAEVASDRERLSRFEQEARLASSLNHPSIITIHDIAEHEGTTFIAMELVEGRTLRQMLADGPLPVDRALEISIQIGQGLSSAHAAGIVHRDLKPENVMVTSDGLVKILDFGIAKALADPVSDRSEVSTVLEATAEGVVVGTPRYMSPEQVGRGPVDHRSDQFAFGIVLFEMLAGKPPFDGPSLASIITAISHDPPPPLGSVRRAVPRDLARLVRRCLAKKPGDRYPSTADLCSHLQQIRHSRSRGGGVVSLFRGPAVAAALAILLLVGSLGAWMWLRGSERRWAENRAVPEITKHIEAGDLFEAYRLGLRAKRSLADDPELNKLLDRITLPLRIATEPEGATVSIKGYSTPDAPWEVLGTTPLDTATPYALMRWRIEKNGFEPFEGAPFGGGIFGTFRRGLKLEPAGSRPVGTVQVPAGEFPGGPHRLTLPGGAATIPIEAYWIDRFEVSNRQYKEFVDGGGYRDPEHWSQRIRGSEGELSWDEAMATFRDRTGRPGPATWNLGTYPEGEGDLPVGGVSWYEADAYCRSTGKTLPTIYHWFMALGQKQLSEILRFSNFGGDGPSPVGQHQGLGGYGTYDMAGNVAEWCWNTTEDGRLHYTLGGAWNDPTYMFRHLNARPALERLPTHGFRCAAYGAPPSTALLDPIDPTIEVRRTPPVTDEVFEVYRGMYSYDRTDLAPEVERMDETSPHWRKEVVSLKAAYGDQRMEVLLFLPRNAAPPYQPVLWFPGDDVFIFQSSETLASSYLFDFIPRSGRALIYPIYYGMYERFVPFTFQQNEWRDRLILWSKDLGRTIDYLETRDDIDTGKLSYYGFSSGAVYGPILSAIDPRIRVNVLLGSGLIPRAIRPEMDIAHFAPRSRAATLMINGVDDFILPYELSQRPLFELLGAAPENKRHARLEGGHIPSDRPAMIRETLDWLDRHLGPVQTH